MTAPVGASDAEHEFLTVSAQALRTSGAAALDTLGWWDLLPQLDDVDQRIAAFALFRAQGRELVCTPAIGALLAQPYLAGTDVEPGSVLATVPWDAPGRGRRHVVVGRIDGRRLLVDHPGQGATIVEPGEVELRPIEGPGRLVVHEVGVERSSRPVIDETRAAAARNRSLFLGRVGLAFEIVGAAEGALALAIDHAANRAQFGEPIGRFQAVRHLLAWAATDCTAAVGIAQCAVALGAGSPAHFDEVTKAIAGRNGRAACERTLQVLGGIGFTAEHEHHHHHQRVLALDVLAGSSAQLTRDLGSWLRTERVDPSFAATLIAAGSPG